MAVPETPITRLEKYWAAILDKIQGGGSAPVLETLTVSENGTYTPGEGVDGFDRVIVGVEQEWRKVTFTGTLAAPFSPADLWRILDDNADIIYGEMAIDATAIGAGSASAYLNRTSGLSFSVADIPSTTVSDVTAAAVAIAINDDPPAVRLKSARMMQQGAIIDISQYASLMPTTTTFVYHVRPSN